MTTAENDVTADLAALQRLPEDDREPDALDPTCATTGVTPGPGGEDGLASESPTGSPLPASSGHEPEPGNGSDTDGDSGLD